jgi:enolase
MSDLVEAYASMIKSYDVIGIQQPFESEDLDSYLALKAKETGALLFAEDSFIMNKQVRDRAFEMKAVSGAVLRLDKIGTVTESVSAARLCSAHDLVTVIAAGPT